MKPTILLALPLLAAAATAAPRTSADYIIPANITDAGGRPASSADYRSEGSIGAGAGIATAPAEVAKHGYISQLYEIVALELTADPLAVPETATLQLGARAIADDTTTVAMPATSITWSVHAGPLTDINSAGIATAGPVYQNSTAIIGGTFGPLTAELAVSVLDTVPDNFGSYAYDGLDDDWQHQYFGPDNPVAAPGMDPDGDGQTNFFEFTAGLVPTEPTERFTMVVQAVPGETGQKILVFGPRFVDRNYTVQYSADMSGLWQDLTDFTIQDDGATRSVIDHDATAPRKFYRIEISKP
jgi:hypothetical protein